VPPFVSLLSEPDGTPNTIGRKLPVTVLLNRLPRLEARSDGTQEGRAIMSSNVMIGAVLILLMIMLLSAFALEATACSVGVPKCD
jgi:hypothetical protein